MQWLPNIAQRDCDLLNSSIVQFKEIQFLASDSSESGSSSLVVEFPHAQPISKAAEWSLYRAVYNGSPVMVKEVKILDSLPNRFSLADIQALWSTPVKMETYRLLREVIVGLALPRHGNLSQVIGWALPPAVEGKVAVTSSFFIILDRFDTDLGSYLDRLYRTKGLLECSPEVGGPLGWGQFFLVATELAAGLTRLGQVRSGSGTGDRSRTDYVIHGDLKLANVFVSYALPALAVASSASRDSSRAASQQRISSVAIGNFSRSRIEGGESAMLRATTTKLGALCYQAPELLDPIGFPKEERLTPQIDIFSYGIVLWRMLHYPKQVEEDFEVQFSSPESFHEAVAKGEIQPTMDPSIPADIAALILDCCAHRPSKRPQARELLDRLSSTAIYRKFEKRGDAQ